MTPLQVLRLLQISREIIALPRLSAAAFRLLMALWKPAHWIGVTLTHAITPGPSVDAPLAPGAPRPFGPLLKVLLLTGQRRNEVAGMTRDELRDDGATWHIPGSRTKNGRAHVVPLPPLVRELIASVRAKARQSRFHDNRHDGGVGLEPDEGPPGRGDARRRARRGSRGHSAVEVA